MSLRFGWGVSNSWGFGVDYDSWSKAVNVFFIHWYAYVEWWPKNAR